ncbi:hypothetical protein TNCV_4839611 [Trichonephila clavipes]|nr:hypothetical protein TNCV_4839611 [Trichonephila clavipes]
MDSNVHIQGMPFLKEPRSSEKPELIDENTMNRVKNGSEKIETMFEIQVLNLAALREHRRLKDLRKCPISRIGLRNWEFGCAARKRTGTVEENSPLLWLKEPPVTSVLQQVVDPCHASWRFRGRQYEKFCDTF